MRDIDTIIELENSWGRCPFLVETHAHPGRAEVGSVEDAVRLICRELRLPTSPVASDPSSA